MQLQKRILLERPGKNMYRIINITKQNENILQHIGNLFDSCFVFDCSLIFLTLKDNVLPFYSAPGTTQTLPHFVLLNIFTLAN